MISGPLVLVPPFLVLFLAFYTRDVIKALGCGIITAALIGSKYSLYTAISIVMNATWEQLDLSNMYIFGFLTFLGVLISLMTHTGGTRAYARFIGSIIHTQKNAESASLLLSCCLLIDDFFSSITVGSIMKSVTDHFSIPRAKLAFLIDATAAPLVLLVPFSSWIPMLTKQLQKGGISHIASDDPYIIADPFATYLAIMPYLFYSFVIISGAWFIVRQRISFGLMKQHEEIADETSNVFGGKLPIDTASSESSLPGSLADFSIPITLFIGSIFTLLLYTGDSKLFGGTASFVSALLSSDMFVALFYGSLFATIGTIILFTLQKKIAFAQLPELLWEGSTIMSNSIVVLLLAWTFGTILKDDLNTGAYLAQLVLHTLPLWLLPAVLFVTSAITSIATGSSWGTIAVLTPLIIPMSISLYGVATPVALHSFNHILPLLGALFSGAVAGDHVSPISSTTLMSSTSSGCYHTDHVNTQFQYALPAMIGSTLGFMFVGISPLSTTALNVSSALAIAIFSNIIMLYVLNKK